jgi:hypothetical protein
MQGYDGYYLVLALAKTVIRQLAEVPRGSGAGRLVFAWRLQPLSRTDKAPTGIGVPVWRTGAQKPVEANDIYRPVVVSCLFYSLLLSRRFCLQDHDGSPKSLLRQLVVREFHK